MTRLRNDTRGSSGAGLNFLLALGAGALMGYLLQAFIRPFIDLGRAETTSDTALRALSYSEAVILYFGLVVLLTAFFYLITNALVNRRLGI